jgi:hypothetical protein
MAARLALQQLRRTVVYTAAQRRYGAAGRIVIGPTISVVRDGFSS